MKVKAQTIIQYLDDYLAQTNQVYINPVDANKILAKANILPDSKTRPGKPLRGLLRNGLIPHAFQENGFNSSWKIPHSNFPGSTSCVSNTEKITDGTSSQSEFDFKTFEDLLMSESNFKIAGSIDEIVIPKPGVYCIRINNIDCISEPYSAALRNRRHNILYIGIATQNLRQRLLYQELRAKGHGTFFRSIGAICGHRPINGSLSTKLNKRNYRFSPIAEKDIIEWINKNLKVNWIEFYGDFKNVETVLINKYKPVINILKNPHALTELTNLRNECIRIANGN